MKNLKNITTFGKFKNFRKLNEELAKGDDPFINVKGNFAGAEDTFVGSMVIKLFNFVKRKGQQAYLFAIYKPRLRNIYMSSVIRYIIANKMSLPSHKEYYECTMTKNVNGEVVDQTKHNFKFIYGVGNKFIKTFVKDADVMEKSKDGSDTVAPDGIYIVNEINVSFTVVGGKVTNISDELVSNATTTTTSKGETETTKATPEEIAAKEAAAKEAADAGVNPDKDIVDFSNKIKEVIDGDGFDANEKKDLDYILGKITEINTIISSMEKNGLKEIKEILGNNKLPEDERKVIEVDKQIYEINIKKLNELKDYLKAVGVKTTTTPNTQPVTVSENHASIMYTEYLNEQMLNEEADTVEPVVVQPETPEAVAPVVAQPAKVEPVIVNPKKASDKYSTVDRKRVGDELDEINDYDINLNDPEFVKQFDKEEVRRGVTDMTLRENPDIVKVQLRAERMYMDNSGNIDRKLENDWKRMVQDVKRDFTKFMITEEVDPFVLVKGVSSEKKAEYNKESTKPGGIASLEGNIRTATQLEKNTNIPMKPAKSLSKNVGSMYVLDMVIGKSESSNVLFVLDTLTLDTKKYYTYRLLGSVELDELIADTESEDLSKYVKRLSFPKGGFAPIEASKQFGEKVFQYAATYIVANSPNTHMSLGSNNKLNIMYLYAIDPNITVLTAEGLNIDYVLVLAKEDGTTIQVKQQPVGGFGDNKAPFLHQLITNKMPYEVDQGEKDKLGLSDKDLKLRIGDIGESLGMLKQLKK